MSPVGFGFLIGGSSYGYGGCSPCGGYMYRPRFGFGYGGYGGYGGYRGYGYSPMSRMLGGFSGGFGTVLAPCCKQDYGRRSGFPAAVLTKDNLTAVMIMIIVMTTMNIMNIPRISTSQKR